ncbi:hypothetical protein ACFXQA_09465 [Microbacterium sp. P07]|uniref:hypothetical protein n=1 Tax=Microbacterium sp. P07 TaxID=3366952 RepID=UPI003744E5DF
MSVKRRMLLPTLWGIALLATGCAPADLADPQDPGEWIVDPVVVSTTSAESGPVSTDVGLPAATIAGDGAGGFWAGSESVAHYSADDPQAGPDQKAGAPNGQVQALSARDADTLFAVSTDPVGRSVLSQWTAASATWTTLRAVGELYGDVAATADAVLYVEFGEQTVKDRFVIRRLVPGGAPTTVGPEFVGSEVRIAPGRGGAVFVVTDTERFVLAADGGVSARVAHDPADRPVGRVSLDGAPLWTDRPDIPSAGWYIATGSDEARKVIEDASEGCDDMGDRASSPSCGWDATWLDAQTFVTSVGGEGGAVLAVVRAP